MAATHHHEEVNSKEAPAEKTEEYVEIRIPKFTKGVPLPLVIVLVGLSYLSGILTMRLIAENSFAAVPTDATNAFIAYAKDVKLDTKKFRDCLTTQKYKSQITSDISNGESFQVSATPSFFVNGRMLVGAQDYSLFKEMINQELTGNRSPITGEESSTSAQMNVGTGHLPPLGDKNAKVKVVEFSDFQCPFCESFFTNTYPQLRKEFVDSGKVEFIFRHFPLTSIHPNSETAHMASECANEQGKFWDYHDKLFTMQQTWADLPLVAKPTAKP